jgi:hypothetical protein
MSAADAINWSAVADSVVIPCRAMLEKLKSASTFEEINDDALEAAFALFSPFYRKMTEETRIKIERYWEVYTTMYQLYISWKNQIPSYIKESDFVSLKIDIKMTCWYFNELLILINRLSVDDRHLFTSVVEDLQAFSSNPVEMIKIVKHNPDFCVHFKKAVLELQSNPMKHYD